MKPVPAATVVLLREAPKTEELEALLLLRNTKLAFHGGHWVFPGGRIDQEDFDPERGLEYQAAKRAAVRETFEETGIEINESDLVHTAHWTTPPNLPRRFCTWFFVCTLRESVPVNVDYAEILDHRWLTPSAALQAADTSEFVLPRPTLVTLRDIAPYKTRIELEAYLARGEIRVFPESSPFYKPSEMGLELDGAQKK
jgi:8-oxo-dGTP pyrophosphatase MutT (NUDIX family)